MEGTSTLTIESHNLSERLSDDHLEALVKEISETVCISIEESRSESLVGSVEEGEKLILFTDIGDLSPLFLSRVNSSGVMGASVEKHNGSSLGLGEILKHSSDVETLGLGVEVSVLVDSKATGAKDRLVVTPGRVADVNRSASVFLQKGSENVEGTSSRKSLGRCNSSTSDVGVLPSEESTSRSSAEVGITIDGSIFFI